MKSKKLFDGKILVIGLGEIGYTCSEYLHSIGIKVDGFDISESAIKMRLKRAKEKLIKTYNNLS